MENSFLEKLNYRDIVSMCISGMIFHAGLMIVGYNIFYDLQSWFIIKDIIRDYEFLASCACFIMFYIEGQFVKTLDNFIYDILLFRFDEQRTYNWFLKSYKQNTYKRYLFFIFYGARIRGQKFLLYRMYTKDFQKRKENQKEIDTFKRYKEKSDFIKNNLELGVTTRINSIVGMFKGIMCSSVILSALAIYTQKYFLIYIFVIIFLFSWIRKYYYAKEQVRKQINIVQKKLYKHNDTIEGYYKTYSF